MKIILLNGSPNEHGCTDRALTEIKNELDKNGVQGEIVWLGKKIENGCVNCRACDKTGKCVFDGDIVNKLLDKVLAADGLIVGSPVYYANINGSLLSALDRLFILNRGRFRFKVGAAVASCRRGGSTASLCEIEKFFEIAEMPVVSSTYWNMVHGNTPEEVERDAEGLQTMRNLAKNAAYLVKCMNAAKGVGILPPERDVGQKTNFVR